MQQLVDAGYPQRIAEVTRALERRPPPGLRHAHARLLARARRTHPGLVSAAPEAPRVHSVASFNRGLAGYVDRLNREYRVEGEISELSRNDRWAYVYLTLKDPLDGSTLPVTLMRGTFDRLAAQPQVGHRVLAVGKPRMNEQNARLSLYCRALEPVGDGALLAEIEARRARLSADGLFDERRKRSLPFWPRTIGLISGRDAAASRDVVATTRHRFPAARFTLVETAVQGPGAARQLISALRSLDAREDVDVIVLTRGGGSLEDLLPFSDEALCRAIAASATPVVSAVGHERDTPLCDLVADAQGLDADRCGPAPGPGPRRARRGPRPPARERPPLRPARRRAGRARPGRARRAARAAAARALARDPARRARPGPHAARPASRPGRRPATRPARGARRPAARPRACGDARAGLRDRPRPRPRRARRRHARAGSPGRPAARPRQRGGPDRGGRARVSTPPQRPVEELSFEEARDELERVVQALEDGRTSLDEALTLWERGEQLYRACRTRLDAAEERIARLAAALDDERPDAG